MEGWSWLRRVRRLRSPVATAVLFVFLAWPTATQLGSFGLCLIALALALDLHAWTLLRQVRSLDRDRLLLKRSTRCKLLGVLARCFAFGFSTRGDGQGHGLGLAVSKETVEGLGGRLALESTPGQGTRATLRLPLARG